LFLPAWPFIYGDRLNLRTRSEVSKGWTGDAVIEIPDRLVIGDVEALISRAQPKVGDLRTLLQSPEKNKNIEKELGEHLWVLI